MGNLDLTNIINTIDIKEIEKRSASSTNILEAYTTQSKPGGNVTTFQDQAQIVKNIPSDKDTEEGLINLEKDKASLYSKELGYPPKQQEDVEKAIGIISKKLKGSLYNKVSFETKQTELSKDAEELLPREKSVQMLRGNASLTSKLQDKNNKFSNLFTSDPKLEQSLVNSLNAKKTLGRSIYDDSVVTESIENRAGSFLDNIKGSDDAFISDLAAVDYLPSNLSGNVLNDLKTTLQRTAKFAVEACNNFVDLLETMFTSLKNMIAAILKFLKAALSGNSMPFLSDILECFGKIKDILFDTKNAKQIGREISKIGSVSALQVLVSKNHDSKYNYKKLLYNTAKNTKEVLATEYNNIKNAAGVVDDGFTKFSYDNALLSSKPNIGSSHIVKDISKYKGNYKMSQLVAFAENKASSANSTFLSAIPLTA